MTKQTSIKALDEWKLHKATLIAYMHEKIKMQDWHGVSDCANDLRVLEATAWWH
jgi:hypothetical protein